MAATPFVPGPSPLFVSLLNSGTPAFLGFARDGVSFTSDPRYIDYSADYSGGSSGPPADRCYLGEVLTANFELVNWDPVVLLQLQDYVRLINGTAPGSEVFGEVGTLCAYEKAAVEFWALWPYAAKIQYAGHPLGVHCPRIIIERMDMPRRGATPASINVSIYALREINDGGSVPTLSSLNTKLWDHNMTAVSTGVLI